MPTSTDPRVNGGENGVKPESFNYHDDDDNAQHGNRPAHESSYSYELHEDSVNRRPPELS